MAETRKCGDCARFKVPDAGCPWHEDVRKGMVKASDPACQDFYEKPKAKAKEKEKKIKKTFKDSGISLSGCFEAVFHQGKPCFLVRNSESFSVADTVEVNGETFYPKELKHIPYEPYDYFEGAVPNREELFWRIWHEIDTFVDVDQIWKDVLSACVLLSYQQEKLQTVPYLYLYGDNESGKSTVLQLLKFLCYRPMYGVTIPPADLYGFLEDSDGIGCILEDEVQGIHKDTDKIKIYKAGYKQGAIVPRTILTQHDRIIKYYRTFCFKACASEQIPQVKGFNERFLFIPMVEGFPAKEWADITKDDLKRLHDLRNMLLKWRMLSRDWELPDVEVSMKGRLKELWKPILQITSGLTVYDGLFKFVETQKNERLSAKQNTLEGHIVKVVVDLYNQAKEPVSYIPFQTIWHELAVDLDAKLDEKKPNVMDTGEFFQVSKNKVGYRLREILSGKSKPIREKDSEGNDVVFKAYEFEQDKLRRIAKKYGYEIVTKLLSEPSSERAQAPETMEKTEKIDGKNVEKGPSVPGELGYISYLVTDAPPSSLSYENVKWKSAGGEKGSNLVTITTSKLSIQEVLEKMRFSFVEGTAEEWISLAMDCGLSEKEAQSLFESLKGEELFWFDRDGETVWRWVRQ